MTRPERVVLAPGMAFPITVWRGEDEERAVYIMEGSDLDDDVTYLSAAEARHLRDLLCEWLGLPDCNPAPAADKEEIDG